MDNNSTIVHTNDNILLNLNTDLLLLVLSFLDNPSRISLGCVSKTYHQFEITIFMNGRSHTIKPFRIIIIRKVTKPYRARGYQKNDVFDTIISCGYVDLFRYWMPYQLKRYIAEDYILDRRRLCKTAASTGSLGILKLIRIPGDTYLNLSDAAKNGHFAIVKWLHENRQDDLEYARCDACTQAARGGYLEILKWLVDNGYSCDRNTLTDAVIYGDIEIIQWLLGNGCILSLDAFECAARYGHLDILKLFHERDSSFYVHSTIFVAACKSGRIDILEWLLQIGCAMDATVCERAAQYGHIDILKWLREHDCPWNSKTSATAAIKGHLDILTWAHENGCSMAWPYSTIHLTISRGHLNIIKYVHENRIQIFSDARFCNTAIEAGHFDILKYLHEIGCPRDEDSSANAAIKGNSKIMKYLHDNECHWNIVKKNKIKIVFIRVNRSIIM